MKFVLIFLLALGFTNGWFVGDIFNEDSATDDQVSNVRLLNLRSNEQTMIDLVTREGYTIEDHYIVTTDGYILNIHRIPKGKNGKKNNKVVLLQHGILGASSDWIILGPGKALGYILADEGYDVWFGNARGNTYSRNHTTLNPDKDSQFWDFSWHEMGLIDLPQTIDYILNKTEKGSIYYCAHSQGTTMFYVMNSLFPRYNDKVKVKVGLAPIAFVSHMKNPLVKFLSHFRKPLSIIFSAISLGEFLPRKSFLSVLSSTFCSEESVIQPFCSDVLFAICGYSPHQLNMTLLPEILAHTPAGSSVRQFLHFAQEIGSGQFRQYDKGFIGNLLEYGSLTPPEYRLDKVTTPSYLFHSDSDWLSAGKDIEILCRGLKNCEGKFLVPEYFFNHMDFCYGINASELVYNKVVSIFSRH